MEWNEKQKKRAVGAIIIGAAAITVTTVVMAAGGMGGGGGGMGGGPGGGGQLNTVEKSASIITVKLETPTIGMIQRDTEFIGKIQSADTTSVYPEASGKISQIHYDVGDYVEAGDLLMELDTADLQFALEKAQVSYESSVASYESTVASANKTLGTDYTSKILSAENSLEKAQESYRQARLNYKSEIDSEDDNIDSLMEKKDNAETVMDDLLDEYNHMKSSATATSDDLSKKYDEYLVARDAYNNYADQYSDALDDYDDYKSSIATSKNNAYKDLVKAQQEMELATGDAYQEQKNVTEAQLKVAKLNLQSAEFSLEDAQRSLDKTRVYAPVSGKIMTRDAKLYSNASSNTAAFTIKDDESVELVFNASSDGASALHIGDNVTVTRGSETYTAVITEIETEADTTSGLFPIKATLEENANLLPGISVKVSATTAKVENALMIPIDSVYYDVDQPYVFTYVDGLARRIDLVTGMSNESTIVVEDGLDSTSLIITTWHPDLADGVSVILGEGMQQVVDAAATAEVIKPTPTSAAANSTPAKTTTASSKAEKEEETQEEDREELLLYNEDVEDVQDEIEDSFGIELPEEPVYPDEPYTKDLSPAYVGDASTASRMIAESILKNSTGEGVLNKK